MKELVNQVHSTMSQKDQDLSNIMIKIDDMTKCLSDSEVSYNEKYKVIVGLEYLLVRARILVESEHLSVKTVLHQPNLTIDIKTLFTKRDQYLAQAALKLTSIREDIAILQKVVYTSQNFIK